MEPNYTPLTADELARLPVFPLPRVVFFPHTQLPLHLFEPRYRALIEDCLTQGPRAMAVALLQPGWESDYEGRPPIHSIAGAGRIVQHEKLPDGTYNVLLHGVSRVRLEEHPAEAEPYRRARAAPLLDHGTLGSYAGEVEAMMACASTISAFVRRQYPEFSLDVERGEPAGRIADRIADRLVADVATRQRILETVDVTERVKTVTDALGELLATLDTGHTKHHSN